MYQDLLKIFFYRKNDFLQALIETSMTINMLSKPISITETFDK